MALGPSPTRMVSRRAVVKGCLTAAIGAVALGAGYAAWSSLAPAIQGPRRVEYVGAALLSGPAQRGVPMLPLRVRADGVLEGVAQTDLDAFRYCAREDAAGLREGGDERLRYHVVPGREEQPWYADRVGQLARTSDFTAERDGALVAWRSANAAPKGLLLFNLVRLDAAQMRVDAGAEQGRTFLVALPDGAALAAFYAACPHFCCTMGYHESPLARPMGAWDDLFCSCHFVTCDPRHLVRDFFLLAPPQPR